MRATQPGQSALLLLDVVDVLRAAGVRYAVLGALAASVHGLVRASLDADAVAFIGASQAAALRDSLVAAGLATTLRRGDPDDPIAALLAVEDSHGNRVDLLIGLRGLTVGALERAIEVPFQGASLTVLDREDFIATKLFAGGPQDLADAAAAVSLDRATLDVALLQALARAFGPESEERLRHLLAAELPSAADLT